MTAVPTVMTAVAGAVFTAAEYNTFLNGPLSFLLSPPIFRGRQTAAQSIANSSVVAITLDAEDVDSAGGHSTVTNNSRYTAVYAGWYLHLGAVSYANNVTGVRNAVWAYNGVEITGSNSQIQTVTSAAVTRIPAPGTLIYLNVGDYTQICAFQNSGGALNTSSGTAGYQCEFDIIWESN